MAAELFDTDDRQTDTKELIFAFSSCFVKSPTNHSCNSKKVTDLTGESMNIAVFSGVTRARHGYAPLTRSRAVSSA